MYFRSGPFRHYSFIHPITAGDTFGTAADFVYEPFLWEKEYFNDSYFNVSHNFDSMDAISSAGIFNHLTLPLLITDPQPYLNNDYLKGLFFSSPNVLLKFIRVNGRFSLLKSLSPGTKFIFIIRNPADSVNSVLSLFSFFGGEFHHDDFPRFLQEVNRVFEKNLPPQDFPTRVEKELFYWEYMNSFALRGFEASADKPLILCHEEVVKQRGETVEKLCTFLGLPVRREYSRLAGKKVGAVTELHEVSAQAFEIYDRFLEKYMALLDRCRIPYSFTKDEILGKYTVVEKMVQEDNGLYGLTPTALSHRYRVETKDREILVRQKEEFIEKQEKELLVKEQRLREKIEQIREDRGLFKEKNEAIAKKNTLIKQKKEQIKEKQEQIKETKEQIEQKERQLEEKNERIDQLNDLIGEQEEQMHRLQELIEGQKKRVAQQDDQIQEQRELLGKQKKENEGRVEQIRAQAEQIGHQAEQIEKQVDRIKKQDGKLKKKNELIAQKKSLLEEKNRTAKQEAEKSRERERQLNNRLSVLQREIERSGQKIETYEQQLKRIYDSYTFWIGSRIVRVAKFFIGWLPCFKRTASAASEGPGKHVPGHVDNMRSLTPTAEVSRKNIAKQVEKGRKAVPVYNGPGNSPHGGLRLKGAEKKSLPGKPLVTVVTVVKNDAQALKKTLDSITGQTYDNIEFILIDGASTDGTLELVKEYEDRIDFWVSEADKGIYDAMNKGIALASGDWINFMNAGDFFYEKDTVEKVFAKDYGDADFIYGDTFFLGGDFDGVVKAWDFDILWKTMVFTHQSLFARAEVLRRRCFDTRFKICADYNIIFNSYMEGLQFFNSDTVIAAFDPGISELSRSRMAYEKWKVAGKYRNDWEFHRFYIKLFLKRFLRDKKKKNDPVRTGRR